MVKTMKDKKATPVTRTGNGMSRWCEPLTPTWAALYTFFAINALDILRAILTQNNVAAIVNILDYVLLPITKIVFVVIQPPQVSLALLSITVFLDLVWKYVLAALIARYALKK